MTNKVIALGNLTADPTSGSTNNGRNYTNFTLAVTTSAKDATGKYATMFYRVSAFGKMGENCSSFLRKGNKAMVVGDFSVREYKDTNGKDRIAYQINADTVEFLTPKSESNTGDSNNHNEELNPDESPF